MLESHGHSRNEKSHSPHIWLIRCGIGDRRTFAGRGSRGMPDQVERASFQPVDCEETIFEEDNIGRRQQEYND